MSETAIPTSRRHRLARLFLYNPVTVKELRSRMRGARGFVLLTLHALLMSGLILLIYAAYAATTAQPFGPDPRQAGKPIFGTVIGIQALVVTFLAPAFTTGAITGEKERQTYDLLRTTLLPAHSLVLGKLFSALSFVLLLIIVAIPLESIAFLLGGVAPVEVVVSQLLLLVSAVAFSLIGLFFSTLFRSTLAASVNTFAVSLIIIFGIPAMALLGISILNPFLFGWSTPSWIQEVILAYGGLFLASINLPATMIVSEVFLLDRGALFYWTETFGGRTFYMFSPWWMYIILYSLLSIVLYWLCVRLIKRTPVR